MFIVRLIWEWPRISITTRGATRCTSRKVAHEPQCVEVEDRDLGGLHQRLGVAMPTTRGTLLDDVAQVIGKSLKATITPVTARADILERRVTGRSSAWARPRPSPS